MLVHPAPPLDMAQQPAFCKTVLFCAKLLALQLCNLTVIIKHCLGQPDMLRVYVYVLQAGMGIHAAALVKTREATV